MYVAVRRLSDVSLRRERVVLRPAPRFKYDDRGLHRAPRRVAVQVLVDLTPPVPQPVALLAMCFPSGDPTGAADQIDRYVRMRLDVEPPSGFGFGPSRSWPW